LRFVVVGLGGGNPSGKEGRCNESAKYSVHEILHRYVVEMKNDQSPAVQNRAAERINSSVNLRALSS
jgi:hypothetical protein